MQTRHLCVLIHISTRVRLACRDIGLSPPEKYFYWPFKGGASFVDYLCYFCLVLLCFRAHIFIGALWSPAGKGLIAWLSFMMSNCEVVIPIGILGQVWCLIVSIPDLFTFFLLHLVCNSYKNVNNLECMTSMNDILTNIHVRIYVFDKIYIGPLDGIRVFIFKK